jgi:TRAP-type uncharacterized transport system fused permease subunit
MSEFAANTVERKVWAKRMITDGVYGTLTSISRYVLPFLAALYFGGSVLFGLPYEDFIVGAIVSATIVLNCFLGFVHFRYRRDNGSDYDGILQVDTHDPSKDVYSLVVLSPIQDLKDMAQVTFRVMRSQ